jgi:hypothetical protein
MLKILLPCILIHFIECVRFWRQIIGLLWSARTDNLSLLSLRKYDANAADAGYHQLVQSALYRLATKLRNDLITATDIMQCRLLDIYRNLSVLHNLHFQDWKHKSTFHILHSFKNFPEFSGIIYRNLCLPEHCPIWSYILKVKLWIEKCTLTAFVAFRMRSERNSPKNWEPTVGFSFTTMLQHTSRFWSKISYQRIARIS